MRRKAQPPDAGELTKRFNVRVTPDLHRSVMQAALDHDTSAQALVTLGARLIVERPELIPSFADAVA